MADGLQFGSPYAAQQHSIDRRRDMLNAMSMQALQPLQGRMVGSQYAAPGPLDALGKVLSAYIIGNRQKALDKESAELTQQYQQALSDRIGSYLSSRSGGPDAERAAAVGAVASGFSPLAAIGMHDLKTAGPQLGTAGDVVFDKKTGNVVQLQGARPELQYIGGDLYQVSPSTGAFKTLNSAPSVTVNTSTSPTIKGESAFMKSLGQQTAEGITQAQTDKLSAEKVLATVQRLEALNESDTFTGPAANVATNISAFAQAMGLPVDEDKLVHSEAYTAALNAQIATYLTAGAGVGRSMTDADRQKIESQFPTLVNTKEGRQEVIRILRDASQRQIKYADDVFANVQQQYPEAARLLNVMPSTQPFPRPVPQQQQAKPISLKQYLQSKQP